VRSIYIFLVQIRGIMREEKTASLQTFCAYTMEHFFLAYEKFVP
jgi:hypothetical protein